jgi:hypothetical protein
MSGKALRGRDIYIFIEKDRTALRRAITVAALNITLELDLVLRPLERKPLVVRALITREPDGTTVVWEFSQLA